MKTISTLRRHLLPLAFLALGFVVTCFVIPGSFLDSRFEVGTKIGEVVNGEGVITTDKGTIIQAFELAGGPGSDITEVHIGNERREWYLYANGKNATGGCMNFKATLTRTGDDLGFTANGQGVTESCSGVNCEQCVFENDGDGCDCEEVGSIFDGSASYCNHTITKGGIIIEPGRAGGSFHSIYLYLASQD